MLAKSPVLARWHREGKILTNLEELGFLGDGAKAMIRGADDITPVAPCRHAPAAVLAVPANRRHGARD